MNPLADTLSLKPTADCWLPWIIEAWNTKKTTLTHILETLTYALNISDMIERHRCYPNLVILIESLMK